MAISFDCEQVRISAMAAADGEEGSVSPKQISEHLRGCVECRQEVERLSSELSQLLTIRRAESTDGIWTDLETRLREDKQERPQSWQTSVDTVQRVTNNGFPRRVALTSTAACLLLTGLLAWRIGDSERLNHAPESDYLPLRVSIGESALDDDSIEEERTIGVPFRDESLADDIALAVVGEPLDRDGTNYIRMQLLAVYKGQLPLGRFDLGQNSHIQIECSMPEHSKSLLTAGNRLALYLEKDTNRGWTVTSIRNLDGSEDSWQASVKRFCDVFLACESDDPAARYRELLLVNGEISLDTPAYYALMSKPCPHAVEAVRPLWHRAIASLQSTEQAAGELPGGGGGGFDGSVGSERAAQENVNTDETAIADQHPGGQQAVSPASKEMPHALPFKSETNFSQTLAIARLLARLHDDRSVETVLQHGLKQPPGSRADYIVLLPDLCQNADANTIHATQGILKQVLQESGVEAETPPPDRDRTRGTDDDAEQLNVDTSEEFNRIRTTVQRLQKLIHENAPEL